MFAVHRVDRFGLLLLLLPAALAQPSKGPAFEVASIRQDLTTDGHPGMTVRHGKMNATKMTLAILISAAYDLEQYQITGGPDWVRTDPYDISATSPGDVPTESFDWWRPMLRSLLADRFKLVLRHETKEMPVYNLVPAKGGVRITPIKDGSCTVVDPQTPPQSLPGGPPARQCNTLLARRTSLDATGITMSRLRYTFAAMLHRFVFDKTGFNDMFDLHMDYAPVDITDADSADISSRP